MSAKIDRINEEIAKTKAKLADFQARLRDLERLKTETENAEIVAMVRGVDVAPEELRFFIAAYQKQKTDIVSVPEISVVETPEQETPIPCGQEVQEDEE